MRTLKFIVEDQIVRPDTSCNFSGLVPGTTGYLQAEFTFSKAWDGYAKVVGFYSMMGYEFEPQALEKDGTCMIPADACTRSKFKIQVLGKRGEDTLKTNKLVINQNGGCV